MRIVNHGRSLAALASCGLFLSSAADVTAQHSGPAPLWDEAVNGPLSPAESAPTILSLKGGSNIIAGEVAANVDDHFSFRVPKGYGLMYILLEDYESIGPLAWIGLQEGGAWTAGRDAEEWVAGIQEQQHFGAANVGLSLLSTYPWPPPGVYWPSGSWTGYNLGAPPVEQDTNYTVKIEQRGARSSYRLDFFLVGLPDPPPTPVITSPKVAQATVGRTFAFNIRTSIPVYSSGVSELPPGLQLDPYTGRISGKPLKAGTFALQVSAVTEEGCYNPPYGVGTGKLTLNVAPGAHRIRFARVPDQLFAPGNIFFLNASSSADCPVYFYSLNPNTVSVTDNVATIHRAGKVTIAAAGGDENYATVVAIQEVTILKERQQIEFDLPAEWSFTRSGRIPLEGWVFSGLPIKYSSSNPRVLSIDGSAAVMKGRGAATITASQPGDDNYRPAPKVSRTIVIK